jgi:hypothetical protein
MSSSFAPSRWIASLSLLASLAACGARGNSNTSPVATDVATGDTAAANDAGSPPTDAPIGHADVRSPPDDVGSPPQDAPIGPDDVGSPPQDVGSPPRDVGSPPQDVRSPPQDVGSPPRDVGSPPSDAGGPPPYVRTATSATLVEACTLPGVQRVLVSADDASATVRAPFTLRFFGQTVSIGTGLEVYSNGFISQGAEDPAMTFFGTIPSPEAPNGVIAPYWVDLVTGPEGVCSVVVGSAPVRRWIVQWKNAQFYSGVMTAPLVGAASFEVIYNESDASFDFIYETITGQPAAAPTRAAVGLENPTGSAAMVVCPGGRTNTAPPAAECTAVTSGTRFRFAPTGG